MSINSSDVEMSEILAGSLEDTMLPSRPKKDFHLSEEINLETTSPWMLKLMLTMWYSSLIVGFLMLMFDWNIQWSCMNYCGGTCTLDVTDWSSSKCYAQHNTTAFWYGNISSITESPLNRFLHLFWTIPNPSNETFTVPILFNVAIRQAALLYQGDVFTFESSQNHSRYLHCSKDQSSCDLIMLPSDVPARAEYITVLTVYTDMTKIIENVTHLATIGAVYQKESYTITGVWVRYSLLLLSLVNLIHYCRVLGGVRHYKEWMPEQVWVMILQITFFLYANPLHAWCIYDKFDPTRRKVLQFIEFHLAQYFQYFVQAFILTVVNCVRFAPAPLPGYVQWLVVSGLVFMISLDVSIAGLNDWDWSLTPTSYAIFNSMSPYATLSITIVYALMVALEGVWMFFGFVQCIRIYFSLGRLPYLETRARQLSFRLIVFVMSVYVLYLIAQLLLLTSLTHNSSLLTYEREQQIHEIFIAFVFVQIITWSYGPTHREIDAPPHPFSGAWKTIPWKQSWHEWLQLHGGSVYFFTSREEEYEFDKIQELVPLIPGTTGPTANTEVLFGHMIDIFAAVTTYTGFRPKIKASAQRTFFCLETAIDCFNLSWEVYYSPENEMGMLTPPQSEVLLPVDIPITPSKRSNTIIDLIRSPLTPFNRNPAATPRATPVAKSTVRPLNVDQYGFNVVKAMCICDVQALVCVGDHRLEGDTIRIAIVFRGTTNQENVKSDMQMARKSWSDMLLERKTATKFMCFDILRQPKVHHGFLKLWTQFQPTIVSTVKDLVRHRQCSQLWITGHSLGGAMATLCAYTLTKQFNFEPTVYTFGAPRMGNTKFKDMYDAAVPNTFRIVNESDIVSRANILMDNPHVGVEISIDRYGNIICSPTFIERMLRPASKSLGIENHLMSSYAVALDAIADKFGGLRKCLEPVYSFENTISGTKSLVVETPMPPIQLPPRSNEKEKENPSLGSLDSTEGIEKVKVDNDSVVVKLDGKDASELCDSPAGENSNSEEKEKSNSEEKATEMEGDQVVINK
eukprot:PhF_6_TR43084/c0_g1_i1/m.65786